MVKINNASYYIGKYVNVLVENKFEKAKLLKRCLGNKGYFTGISVVKTPPTITEVCEMYLVEFENGTVDYVDELYTIERNENNMEYGEINLSLLKNSILVFNNTIGANKDNINMPITYKEDVVGWITDVTEESISCRVFDKFVRFYPEYNSKDGIEPFKLFGINITLPVDEINKQIEMETYVAVEMYKQFMNDDALECAQVRKQILKKQQVKYFKQK